jgi:hypothetical protein
METGNVQGSNASKSIQTEKEALLREVALWRKLFGSALPLLRKEEQLSLMKAMRDVGKIS